ncbi:hypothetical protein [Halodesulfurarchaeum formicicum]|uniref:Uncharacterized protein n=1 Tax=Halodesulfurarchaeum formicicum TaxID=1873524 RepID=A0A1J1ACC2_9EURY|nr:hypothetical protein [Halodesulfurarchaeum formicicum]APE95790.1 hypothetical protein HSR6_1347 [Halodesulfurarchaeum formicicum]
MGRLETPYFGLVGVLLVAAGAVSVLLGLTGGSLEYWPLVIAGPFSIWRGAVVLAAGAFYLTAVTGRITDREDEALVFMGSLMIWIVGGMEVLSILLGAIPGGPEVWIASPTEFLAAIAPPYSPSVLAIPLSLPAFRYAEENVTTLLSRLFTGE